MSNKLLVEEHLNHFYLSIRPREFFCDRRGGKFAVMRRLSSANFVCSLIDTCVMISCPLSFMSFMET